MSEFAKYAPKTSPYAQKIAIGSHEERQPWSMRQNGWWAFLLTFIIVAAVVALALWIFRPQAYISRDSAGRLTDNLDMGRTFWTAVIAGLIAAVIVWLVGYCR